MLFDLMDTGYCRTPDDYRMLLKPRWLDEFWDYNSSRTLRTLTRMVKTNRLPQLSVFWGPPGSGKTIAAHCLACWFACEAMGDGAPKPCGECGLCRCVRFGFPQPVKRSLFEIDAAFRDDDGSSSVLGQINYAYDMTTHYGSTREVRGGKCVVFIDEAHRMTPHQRTTLLKLTEQWPSAYVILATTVLEGLTVIGDNEQGNPLLSRSEIFEFSYPNRDECIDGLNKAAAEVGITVETDAAKWIVCKHACAPRDILGELYRLSSHGVHITSEVVVEEYGESVWQQSQANGSGTDIPNDKDDDSDFQMVA